MSFVNSFHVYQKMRCVFITKFYDQYSFVIKHSIFVLIVSIPCMFCFIFLIMDDQEIYAKAQRMIYIYLFVNIESFMLNILFVVEYRCFKPGTRDYVMLHVNQIFCSCASCVLYDKCGHISFHFLLSN